MFVVQLHILSQFAQLRLDTFGCTSYTLFLVLLFIALPQLFFHFFFPLDRYIGQKKLSSDGHGLGRNGGFVLFVDGFRSGGRFRCVMVVPAGLAVTGALVQRFFAPGRRLVLLTTSGFLFRGQLCFATALRHVFVVRLTVKKIIFLFFDV